MLLKEEIPLHYQNSGFFGTYAKSNKGFGALNVPIKGFLLS